MQVKIFPLKLTDFIKSVNSFAIAKFRNETPNRTFNYRKKIKLPM